MSLAFDPDDYDYGPASPAVRRILREWGATEWFVASNTPDGELLQLFAEHQAYAQRYAADTYPDTLALRVERGGWSEFIGLCARVRSPESGWDWKFGTLKKLSLAHARARGWTSESEADRVKPFSDDPGALFLRLQDVHGKPFMVWNMGRLASDPDANVGDKGAKEAARFWLEYARHDLSHAIEWELAEPTTPNGNPFTSLLACTRAGGYPFALSRDEVLLFRFQASPTT